CVVEFLAVQRRLRAAPFLGLGRRVLAASASVQSSSVRSEDNVTRARSRFWPWRPKSAQGSPTSATLVVMLRSVNERGPTAPRSISSQVHGADTGAPGFGRTAYVAANVAP